MALISDIMRINEFLRWRTKEADLRAWFLQSYSEYIDKFFTDVKDIKPEISPLPLSEFIGTISYRTQEFWGTKDASR